MPAYRLRAVPQTAPARDLALGIVMQEPTTARAVRGLSAVAIATAAAIAPVQSGGVTLHPGGVIPSMQAGVVMQPRAVPPSVEASVPARPGKVYLSNAEGGAGAGLIYTLSQDNVRGADIAVNRRPTEMTSSPDGRYVLVVQNTVSAAAEVGISVINTADDSVTFIQSPIRDGLPCRPAYARVSPASTVAYVSSRGPSANETFIDVLDLATLTWGASFGFPAFTNRVVIAVHPDGTKLYCAGGNSITTINLPALTEGVTVPLTDGISQLLPNHAGTKLYITGAEFLQVYDTATDTIGPDISLGAGATPWGMCIAPDDSKLYIANGIGASTLADSKLEVVDATTDTPLASALINPPGATFAFPWECAITPDGSKVFLTVFEDFGAVAIIDTADLSVAYDNQANGFTWTPNGIAIVPVRNQ